MRELREKYCELEKIVKMINVGQFNEEDISLEAMNRWIDRVIKFYSRCGIVITYNDFKDIFDERITGYKKLNKRVNEYMELFFRKRDDLGSYDFFKLVFTFDDLRLDDNQNPIIDDIRAMIINFNNKHQNIFNRLLRNVKESYRELDLDDGLFTYDKMNVLLEEIKIRILNCDKIMALEEEKEKEKEKDKEEKNNYLEKIYNLLMILTNGKYEKMSDDEKSVLMSGLPYIVDVVKKMRIFKELEEKYDEYSKKSDYEKTLKDIEQIRLDWNNGSERLLGLNRERKDIQTRKSIFRNNQKEIDRLDQKIEQLFSELVEKRDQELETIGNYLLGFYNDYNLRELEKPFMVVDLDSKVKLFGVFDFDKLPITSAKVNKMMAFSDVGLVIPDMNSQEFLEASRLCLEISKSRFNIGEFEGEKTKKR